MTIKELLAETDPLRQQMDGVKRQEKALKVKKARINSQRAQQQLRVAQAPTKP